MIRKIIFIISVLIPIALSSQTVHWLTFIDTNDSNVGELDKNGRNVLYNHFVNVVNAALTEKGYKTNIQDIYGDDLTPELCKEIVEDLDVTPEDIVMFYYIGHGTHGNIGGDIWPLMFLGQDNVTKLVPLKWVHETLKEKGAHLTATIGMCCNVYQAINRMPAPTFGVNYGNTYLTDTEKEAIQKMFLENKGDFLLSSASPGQPSVGGNTILGPMDLFTCVLVKNFEDSASEGDLDWNSLFSDVKAIVKRETRGQQTPIFENNIRPGKVAPKTVGTPTPAPVEPKPTNNITEKQKFLNQLGQALDNLINTQISDRARINQAQELEKHFSTNAMVKVMSQDGNQVIDRSSADSFLGRLSTSRILLKVVLEDIIVSNNQISELKVKEIYKK